MQGDDYYSQLYGCHCCGEAVAMDGTLSSMKSPLSESMPKRIRIKKELIKFVSPSKATNIIYKNVALIKTIPDTEHERITRYIKGVFTGRYSRDQLVNYLMRIGSITEERANMIADDQIAKASTLFLVEKWKSQGTKTVRWVHTGVDEPRKYHLREWNGKSGKRDGMPNGLNGYVFSIDNPPIIDPDTSERGYPGQLVNCRCYLEKVN